MKNLFLTIIFLFAGLTTFGQIMGDSSVQVITYWDKGEKQTYTVRTEKIRIKDSDTLSQETTTYDVELTVQKATKNSYTVKWEYKNIATSATDPITQKIMGAVKDMKVIYRISELGVFLEVENWKEVRGYMKKGMNALRKEYKHVPEMNKIFSQVEAMFSTKEAIEATSINEIQQFHTFHGASYTLGERIEARMKSPNVLGAEPFDTYVSVSLDEIDEQENNYIIRAVQEIDQEQLIEATFNFVKAMAENMNTEPPKREDLGNLQHQTQTTSQIHGTGWVIYSIQTKTVTSDDITNIEETIIELK